MQPSPEISERYIKKHVYAPPHSASVSSGPGFIRETEQETAQLIKGRITPTRMTPSVNPGHGMLTIRGIDFRSLLEIVLRSTCATDIALVAGQGHAENEKQLEAVLRLVRWKLFLRPGTIVAVRTESSASRLYHTGILAEAATKIIAENGNKVSDVGSEAEQTVILQLTHNRLRVLMSLAGQPLWRRGYRMQLDAIAPLREDLAQAAIRRAIADHAIDFEEARRESTPPVFEQLFVPFCGTGTLAFEALIHLLSIPPFVFRDHSGSGYAFEHLAMGIPPSVAWAKKRLKEELAARLLSSRRVHTVMVDSYAPACDSAKKNWTRFSEVVDGATVGSSNERTSAFTDTVKMKIVHEDALANNWHSYLQPDIRSVFIPLNPPYGRRVQVGETASIYQRIGRKLEDLLHQRKQTGSLIPSVPLTITGLILCPEETSWRSFLRSVPSYHCKTSHFSQGGMDIRLCTFRSR